MRELKILSMADDRKDVRDVLHLHDAHGPDIGPADQIKREALVDSEPS